MQKISTSFLSSKDVIDDLITLEATTTDFIHVDVMDGKFVKSKCSPHRALNRLANVLKKRLDVHLMVQKPLKYIPKYLKLNTECICIHVELDDDVIRKSLNLIKSYGILCGLAINPNTDVEYLENYLDLIDVIIVMSVEPGLGGQSFIESTPDKIDKIKKMIGKRNILISVDGGINIDTISKVKKADIVVSGSYIINSDDFEERINSLREKK